MSREMRATSGEADQSLSVEVINLAGRANLVLVCEHASNFIPADLHDLGATPETLKSHVAWDPGAIEVALGLARLLDAPLVAQKVSRLVYDCNRPPEADSAMPEKSEIYDVPGNCNLSEANRARRIWTYYHPFRDTLSRTIAAKRAGGAMPPVVTIHSFTPIFMGQKRDAEIGLLHDADTRLAEAMLAAAPHSTKLKTELNVPYSRADGVTHTLKEHALPEGLLNVMIEIRNDLIADDASIARVAGELARMIERGLSACGHPPLMDELHKEASGR